VGCYSFLTPSSTNDLRRNPLNINTIAKAIATMDLDRGTWNTNAVTKEIAAPTKLYGSLFLLQERTYPNSIFIMIINIG
jgi:hypothetical protein